MSESTRKVRYPKSKSPRSQKKHKDEANHPKAPLSVDINLGKSKRKKKNLLGISSFRKLSSRNYPTADDIQHRFTNNGLSPPVGRKPASVRSRSMDRAPISLTLDRKLLHVPLMECKVKRIDRDCRTMEKMDIEGKVSLWSQPMVKLFKNNRFYKIKVLSSKTEDSLSEVYEASKRCTDSIEDCLMLLNNFDFEYNSFVNGLDVFEQVQDEDTTALEYYDEYSKFMNLAPPGSELNIIDTYNLKFVGTNIDFEHGTIISVALYDSQKSTRISEEFYILSQADKHKISGAEAETMGTMCTFKLTSKSPSIYVVFKIYKVTSGSSHIMARRTLEYWSAFPLFASEQLPSIVDTIYFAKSAQTDDLLCESLRDMKEGIRYKINEGLRIDIVIGKVSNIPSIIDSRYLKIKPFKETSGKINENTNTSHIVRELQAFNHADMYYTYINNLYIYPIEAIVKKKNIRVEVSLLNGETQLPNWFGTVHSPKFCLSSYSSGSEKGLFNDELKVNLPPKLSKALHLRFLIRSAEQKDSILYYGYINIRKLSKRGFTGEHTIYLHDSLPDDYYKQNDGSSISKKTLRIRVHAVSSMYSSDGRIRSLLSATQKSYKPKILTQLKLVKKEEAWRFFPHILHKLLILEADPLLVVESLLHITNKLTHPLHTIDKVLSSIMYTVESWRNDMYYKLCIAYTELLNSKIDIILLSDSSIIFSLIFRGMVLYLNQNRNKGFTVSRDSRFPNFDEVTKMIMTFLQALKGNIKHVTSAAYFIKNLLLICDPMPIFDIISIYVEEEVKIPCITSFLRIVSNYKNFIQLNMPEAIEDDFEDISDVVVTLRRKHALMGTISELLEDYNVPPYLPNDCLASSTPRDNHRILIVQLVSDIFQDFSRARLKGNELKNLESLTLPTFTVVIEATKSPIILHDREEKVFWVRLFLFFLKTISEETLAKYLRSEVFSNKMQIFSFLRTSLRLGVEEGILTNTSKAVALKFMYIYINTCRDDMEAHLAGLTIQAKILEIFGSLFEINFLINETYSLFGMFLRECGNAIFKSDSAKSEISNLVNNVIITIAEKGTTVTADQSSLLMRLLEVNYSICGNCKAMQSCITVAIASIIDKEETDIESLQLLFDKIDTYAKSLENGEFLLCIEGIHEIGNTLIESKSLINGQPLKEQSADVYKTLSDSLHQYPEIRVTWIDNLSKLHNTNEYHEEAAQCKIYAAVYITQYLQSTGVWGLADPRDFFSPVCPNLVKEILPQYSDGLNIAWSMTDVILKLKEAIELFKQATQFELAVRLFILLNTIYEHVSDFEGLSSNLDELNDLCEFLAAGQQTQRLGISYFRVGFYGKGFGEDDGVMYIFKKSQKYNLGAMKKELTDAYEPIFKERLEFMLTNDPLDLDKLEEDKVYIQLAGLNPYVAFEDTVHKAELFDKTFNLNKLVFESMLRGENNKKVKDDDVANQKKKKIVFTTDYAFPYIKSRVKVISSEEVFLTPIENAVELIMKQAANIKEQISKRPLTINSLQQVLQGSVVPRPLKIASIFLNPDEYPVERVKRLIQVFQDFLNYCKLGLKACNHVMEDKHQKLHNVLNQYYDSTKEQIEEKINAALTKLDM